jgi:RNA polymerase sigma-70 factor (ECF subfamily)
MNEPVAGQRIADETPTDWPSADFAGLYDEHCRAIFYLSLRYLGDPQKAQDATHDVFLKAFRRLDQFRGEASVRTWLYRIAINHCQNLCQSWQNRNIHSNADDAVWENSAAPTDSPLRVLETKELGQRIQQTLDALSEEYRLLLLLVADEEIELRGNRCAGRPVARRRARETASRPQSVCRPF